MDPAPRRRTLLARLAPAAARPAHVMATCALAAARWSACARRSRRGAGGSFARWGRDRFWAQATGTTPRQRLLVARGSSWRARVRGTEDRARGSRSRRASRDGGSYWLFAFSPRRPIQGGFGALPREPGSTPSSSDRRARFGPMALRRYGSRRVRPALANGSRGTLFLDHSVRAGRYAVGSSASAAPRGPPSLRRDLRGSGRTWRVGPRARLRAVRLA